MKTALLTFILLSAAPLAAHGQTSSAENLTRLLNSGPPAAARPAPQTPTATPTAAPASKSAPAAATAAATAAPARAPVSTPPVVPVRAPVAPTAPIEAPAQATAAPAPSPSALSAAAIAALPFRIELPAGFQVFEGRSAPDARVWSVRKAGKTFAMIYAGSSSQFPIYDGERVQAAGRVTVVVPEGGRRIAMEHLFQRPVAPMEIHVWLMSLDGADRDAAERIAQSVDPK